MALPYKSSIGPLADTERKSTPNVLCAACKNAVSVSELLKDGVRDRADEWHEHYTTRENVVASSQSGCHLCTLLIHRSSTNNGSDYKRDTSDPESTSLNKILRAPPPEWTSSLTSVRMKWEASRKLHIYESLSPPEQDEILAIRTLAPRMNGVSSQPIMQSFAPGRAPARLLGPAVIANVETSAATAQYTGSNSVFRLAKTWVTDCLKRHEQCQKPLKWSSGDFLPTRLIDIGPSHPNIVLGTEIPQQSPYLALSYCWGGANTILLARKNYRQLRTAIDVQALPKTLADAVKVTRRLSYRYLWVDAVCIMQDDKEDWEREANLMALVYSNAVCTISVASANAASQGCFVWREPLAYLPCRVSGTRSHGVHLSSSQTPYDTKVTRAGTVEDAAINTRAWCVQERLLSKRIFHFTAGGIFWECYSLEASDTNPDGRKIGMNSRDVYGGFRAHIGSLNNDRLRSILPPLVSRFLPGRETLVKAIASKSPFASCHHADLEKAHGLLHQYTQRNLTVKTDRLKGFMEIISAFERATGLKNSYGIWTSEEWVRPGSPSSSSRRRFEDQALEIPLSEICCLLDLLWRREVNNENGYTLLGRPWDDLGFPTWSWASVDGLVTYQTEVRSRNRQDLGIEEDRSREWESSTLRVIRQADFESHEGFALQLRGRLVAISQDQLRKPHVEVNGELHSRNQGETAHGKYLGLPVRRVEGLLDSNVTWFWPDTWDYERAIFDEQVLLLPVLWNQIRDKWTSFSGKEGGVKGLVVVRHADNIYRRVGLFQFGKRSGEDTNILRDCRQWQQKFTRAQEKDFLLI